MAPALLSRADMESDLVELVRLLESTHPDPHAAGGGMIAFRRRVDAIWRALPPAGLSAAGFLRRLRPLVASVGDGHTTIRPAPPDAAPGRRLWLDWSVVEQCLCVCEVYRQQDRPLLGTRLRAANGIALVELVRRCRDLAGADNEYDTLLRLAHALQSPALLPELLDVAHPPQAVRLELEGAAPVVMALLKERPGDPIRPPSAVELPPLDAADLGWGFAGGAAILRIASMARYREVFEFARARGPSFYLEKLLPDAGGPAADVDARIAAVPSATQTLRALFGAMRERGTRTLIVDLRENKGGNSLLALMLAYFLWGPDALAALDDGYQIPRYSALYRQNYPGVERPDGYDFSQEVDWRSGRQGSRQALADFLNVAPTFRAEIHAGTWAAAWSPRVIALTSALTYSAGFDVARILHRLGGELVGVPPGQAGNCFMDALPYRLPRSGLPGTISYKQSVMFPQDPEAGRVLRPDRELTYRDLVALGFDPHATLRLALARAL